MRTGLRVLLAWLPGALYLAVIWWVSSQQIQLPQLPGDDKTVHFLEYGLLGACFAFAAHVTWYDRTLRAALVALWLSCGAGLLDELHQSLVLGRTGDLLDLLADALGATVFVIAMTAIISAWRGLRRGPPPISASL
jgi:VanZ family protein